MIHLIFKNYTNKLSKIYFYELLLFFCCKKKKLLNHVNFTSPRQQQLYVV